MRICTFLARTFLLFVIGIHAHATTYSLPSTSGDTVITQFEDNVALTRAEQDETLLDVARRFLLGQTEIVRLNQDLDRWQIKKGQVVRLANRRILPDTPHRGITLNISEYRMYFYPPNQPGTVMSFAHGVGRQDWKTPLGQTKVARKVKNPSWHPPESIRREHAANGDPLPEIVPPGPHNPLGAYALYLALPGEYRIHGTDIDKIFGIGMQITHGCVRMYPEDIEVLYNLVPEGTPVYIVKQPIKVGWLDNKLYIEAHPDLEGEEMSLDQRYALALQLIQKANNNELPEFDQTILNDALKKLDGDPVVIYERLPPLEGEVASKAPIDSEIPALPVEEPVKKIAPQSSKVKKTTAQPVDAKKTPAKKSSTKQAKTEKALVKKTSTKQAQAQKITSSSKQIKQAQVKKVLAKPAVKGKKDQSIKQAENKRQGSPGGYYHGN